jgi:glycosyltransferase involved in cell wall biosynthesis
MNLYPKISVVTPCFNMAGFIEQTILSVLNQNYPNLEYIIIDGGSTDGSREIIEKYSDRLSYWLSEPDSGMYDAIQKGFDKSTGEIMCWLNADDIFLPNSLQARADLFLKYPKAEWMEGNNVVCNEAGTLLNTNLPKHHTRMFFLREKFYNAEKTDLVSFGTIQQESVFWRRKLWEKAGSKIDTTLKLGGDFELWMRFFRHSELFITPVLLSAFRIRSGQQSAKSRKLYLDEIKNIMQTEKDFITDKDRKIIRFLDISEKFPAVLKSKKLRDKNMFFTLNTMLTLS